jgi:tetratricopeptide (TPR) repeat protein
MSSSDKSPLDSKPVRPAGDAVRWFGDLGLVDLQIDLYERILARNPNYILVLRALGELLALKGRYDRSLEIDRRLVSLVPHDCVARYNLACALAVQGSPRQAIEELGVAMEYGYDDFGHLEIDPDLDSIRHLPAYQALLRQHGIDS